MRTLTLNLTEEQTDELSRRAQAAGAEVTRYAADLVGRQLGTPEATHETPAADSRTRWRERFDALMRQVESRPSRPGPPVDVSRESIYD